MPDKQAERSRPLRTEPAVTGTGVKRPLVPVVLAFMLGLVAAAWGFPVTGIWLVAGLAGLAAVLFLVYWFGFVRGSADKGHDGHDEPTESGRDTDFES